MPSEHLAVLRAHREVRPLPWLDRMGHRVHATLDGWRKPVEGLRVRSKAILEAAATLESLEDGALQERLGELAGAMRLAEREDRATQDEALAGAAAAVMRVTGLTPHPEQVMGALALLEGYIAEMATGEGKTLTAGMAAIVSAWRGLPCHVVTANDYLARRDAELFARLYAFCGLSVSHLDGETPLSSRRAAHRHDVIYSTAKELLGDYLRDRLVLGRSPSAVRFTVRKFRGGEGEGVVMRGIHQVIVDEADSVLVDEAVTPLIISMPHPDSSLDQAAQEAVALARELDPVQHYRISRALRHVELTAAGKEHLETLTERFSAFWKGRNRTWELVEMALYALHLLVRDQHFVVKDEKIVLVDELTGRLADQRTLSLGMQQLLEAAQGLPLSPPSEVSARLSFQRFFRRFPRMGGMTGTAREARPELLGVYRLPTLDIPTHRPVRRQTLPMRLFHTEAEKIEAIVASARQLLATGRAVLIGMRSVRTSEALFARFVELDPVTGSRIELLHAVNHALESGIVAQAGRSGAITIATNMAGRGTDIALDPAVRESGGLHVIIGEPNDFARIDRQLVGRCARQGDPGSVQCFACLEDEVFRRFLPALVLKPWARWLAARPQQAQKYAPLFLRLAQKRAERMSFRQRQMILEQDIQLDKLGF
ncbi:MAG: preprotein translocase subunit SecA [Rhodocyclaceae bacterium]|nr:preprotein translocase subunit SecA [Rhodocyclaceae bacterium]